MSLCRTWAGIFSSLRNSPSSIPARNRLDSVWISARSPALARSAHALKSSAANVGALVLSNSCRELEQLCREDRLDDARALFPRVHREHLRVYAEIDQLLMEIV